MYYFIIIIIAILTKARILDAVAQIIFLLMLILLALGYTVTRGKLRFTTVLYLEVFFALYVIGYSVTFISAEAVRFYYKKIQLHPRFLIKKNISY